MCIGHSWSEGVGVKEKKEQGKRVQSVKKKWQFLTGWGRTGLPEKVSLDQSLKGSKGPSYTDIWGKSIQTRTASAKALR